MVVLSLEAYKELTTACYSNLSLIGSASSLRISEGQIPADHDQILIHVTLQLIKLGPTPSKLVSFLNVSLNTAGYCLDPLLPLHMDDVSMGASRLSAHQASSW